MNKIIRTFDKTGRVSDGLGGIKPGDIFKTNAGRITEPYPKQKSSRHTIGWLINEAIVEATIRGDEYMLFQFQNISFLRETKTILTLTPADGEMINTYLFG